MSLDRFSPLFEQHRGFGIEAVPPCAADKEIFGDPVLVEKVAYYREGQFSTELLDDATTLQQLRDHANTWIEAWTQRTPVVKFYRLSDELCLVVDTRASDTGLDWLPLSLARRCFAVDGQPVPDAAIDDELAEALERGFVLAWEGGLLNLVEMLVDTGQADAVAVSGSGVN